MKTRNLLLTTIALLASLIGALADPVNATVKQPHSLNLDKLSVPTWTPSRFFFIDSNGDFQLQSLATFKAGMAFVKGDVGLGNVDNTSDANKPVSTAQQTALNAKQASSAVLTGFANATFVNGQVVIATSATTFSTTTSLTLASLTDAQAGSLAISAISPYTNYYQIMAQADQKASMLFKTMSRYRGKEPLRWACVGDSYGYYGVPMLSLWSKLGYGGQATNAGVTLTGSSSIVYDDTIFPSATLVRLRPNDTATWPGSGASGVITPAWGSIVKVYYVASGSGGTMTVACDSQMNGSYAIVTGGTINTNNSGAKVNTTITYDLGSADQRRIRLTNTGTTDCYIDRAFTLAATDSSAGLGGGRPFGVNFFNVALGGSTPSSWFNSSQANKNAFLQDYDPHIVSISSLESLGDWQDPAKGFDATVAAYRIAAPNADVICVGQPPSAYGERAAEAVAINEYLRGRCVALGVLFVDPHESFPDRTVTTLSDGVATSTNLLTSNSGSFTAQDVGKTLQVMSGTTLLNAYDSYIATVLSPTQVTTSGSWVTTGTNLTVYKGDAPGGFYVWPPHLGGTGNNLENVRVVKNLTDLLAVPMATYGGAQNIPPWGGGTQGFEIYANMKLIQLRAGQATGIMFVSGGGQNKTVASGPSLGFNQPSNTNYQWNGAYYIDTSGNGASVNMLVGAFGRTELGLATASGDANPSTAINKVTRAKQGHIEMVNGYSNDGASTVVIMNYSSTVPSLDFRTGAADNNPGTLVARIENGGSLTFFSSTAAVKFSAGNTMSSGTGTPEGALVASPGSMFLNSVGGAGTSLYIKESGTGNTGWVAK